MGEIIHLGQPTCPGCESERRYGVRHIDYLRHLYSLLANPTVPELETEDDAEAIAECRKDIRLFRPRCVPPGLIDELRMLFEGRKDVYRIHVLLACHPYEYLPHWLILIDFDGERTSVFPAVTKAVRRYMKPGEPFEVMQADENMVKNALKCAMPIYHKLRIQN